MPGKRRVLFAIGCLGGGGAERQTLQYLRQLDRTRYEPLLYLHERRGELLAQVPGDVPVYAFGERCRPPRVNFPGRTHLRQVRDLAQVLDEQQVDVLCAVTFLLVLVAGAAVRRRPTPWLAIEMADPRLDFPHQVRRFRWLKRRLLASAYRRADRTVAVSAGVRAGIIECYGVRPERLLVVPNSVDLAELDRQLADAVPPWDDGAFHIVSVGRLDAQKGQIYLLQALDELIQRRGWHAVRLHLFGQGPLEQELRGFVREHGLEHHVDFGGFVGDPLRYVQAADLFCLPSIYEGLPLALLEALACGTPVLASDCRSGPREILQDGRYGRLVPPGDAAALADAIQEAAQDPAAGRTAARQGRYHVEQCYSLAVVARQLSHAIEAIAEAGTETRPA